MMNPDMTQETTTTQRNPEVPSFSVIVAAYNTGERILPTIRSVLAQTHRPFEILVIGDGCSDATGEILKTTFGDAVQWQNLDRNYASQSYPNNAGIERSRGSHIAYLGHDDVWSPRHLEKLASIIQDADPDFAVSGTVYHTPPGSMYYQFSGIFDDASTAKREFFPPSSLAHRRDVVDRIGPWRDPRDINAPVDCEFLLRAAANGCSFVSTKVVTVHKFAAGHRYLSYRFPSTHEQPLMLERLLRPGGEAEVLQEIEADFAAGAEAPPILYPDFSRYALGQLYREARLTKGLDRAPLIDVEQTLRIAPISSPAALDWYPPEVHPVYGKFRWSGPNPNPIYWLPVRIDGAFYLRIHVIAFADAGLIRTLSIELDDVATPPTVEPVDDGTYVLTARPPPRGPVTDGLKLCFRMPYSTRPRDDPFQRRIGIALGTIRVVKQP
jgi:glycosyltransferase involved in cell wall biosynthesis